MWRMWRTLGAFGMDVKTIRGNNEPNSQTKKTKTKPNQIGGCSNRYSRGKKIIHHSCIGGSGPCPLFLSPIVHQFNTLFSATTYLCCQHHPISPIHHPRCPPVTVAPPQTPPPPKSSTTTSTNSSTPPAKTTPSIPIILSRLYRPLCIGPPR